MLGPLRVQPVSNQELSPSGRRGSRTGSTLSEPLSNRVKNP